MTLCAHTPSVAPDSTGKRQEAIQLRQQQPGLFRASRESNSETLQARVPADENLKMRDVLQTEELAIPEGVTVGIKSRLITVTGPRGTLTKNVRHINMDIQLIKGKNNSKVLLSVWQGSRKHVACLRTIKSLISNLIKGVTRGFQYKMRAVYAHFPINCIIAEDKQSIEIRNFLGEKTVRHVEMLDGVTIMESKAQKDEIILEGNDIENVSQSAASIQGACRVRNKDIRKFLDGVYVSEKGHVAQE